MKGRSLITWMTRVLPLAALAVLIPLAFAAAQQPAAPAATPAPAAAAPAPAAAAPAPPACDAKTLEKCTPNSGDTAWMLTSMALVLMMTVPGLGLFYGGMVRKKNVGDTVMTSFAITCLVTVLWAILTYSIAFRAGTPFIGGLDRAFLQGILSDISKGIGNPNPLAPTIPETVYMCFQMTFAIITPGADRRRLRRAHEVLGDAVVHRPLGDLRLCADRALGVGAGRLPQQQQRRRLGQGAGLRRRHGGARQCRRRRADVRADARQAQGHGPGAQRRADLHRRRAAVGRLVRLQCRLGRQRRHAGGHGDDRHADRHRGRRAHLDVRRMGASRQADGGRHLLAARSRASSPSPRPRASSARSARW